MAFHPNNTVAKFTTRLSSPVELNGDWEVGMTEVCLPTTWYNITSADHWFKVNDHRFELPDKFYTSIKTLLHTMIEMIKAKEEFANAELRVFSESPGTAKMQEVLNENKFVIFYVTSLSTVVISLPASVRIVFSSALADVLGYDAEALEKYYYYSDYFKVLFLTAHKEARLNQNLLLAYVYCDVIEPTIVGDTKVQLLRTVDLATDGKSSVHHIFTTPVYVPLQKKHFDSIEVNIMTDTGEPVPFASGKSVVVLHFRRTSNPYFLAR